MKHVLGIVFRYKFLSDGSKPNQSIIHVIDRKMKYDWRGPLITYGNRNLHAANGGHAIEDITTEHLRDIVDYLKYYNDNSIRIYNHDIALSGRDIEDFASLLNCANTEAAGIYSPFPA